MKARSKVLMSMAAWVLALGIVIYSAVSFPPQVIEANVPPPIFDTSPTLDVLASKLLAKSVAPLAHPNGQFSSAPTAADRVYLPLILRSPAPVTTEEWTQHAHDAQRTSYTPQVVPPPWRWKWAWNGPDASGGISAGKTGLPRNSQPVTGGGRVYIAAGSRGVFALNNANGAVVWNRTLGGSINSTPAYDDQTSAVFVLASNGTLYKLDAATGNTLGQFATGASSSLPLPPAIANDRVFISMGTKVYALNKFTLAQVWAYEAGSPVHTPPAYSPSRDRVIAASQDLFVHAINNTNGSRAWRVKPTVLNPDVQNEFARGWPVIAEIHGVVLMKIRRGSNGMYPWNPAPTTNEEMRASLLSRPDLQALYAIDLDDGTIPFVSNISFGGFGNGYPDTDGGYLPMGPQPVVKRFPNGTEVVYTIIRGDDGRISSDFRWDSKFGEMVLDDTTVPGYRAGYVRFIQYGSYGWAGASAFILTDEQPNPSMAGDHLFGGHWMVGYALKVLDRSSSRGGFASPITSQAVPHIINSASNCGFSVTHYCPNSLIQDGDPRVLPGGFYIYYNQPRVYDQYWSEYATWVVSNNTVYFVSTDGALVALESGTPSAPVLSAGLDRTAAISPVTKNIASSPDDVISPRRTWEFVGQVKTVEGEIHLVNNNGQAIYLMFQETPPDFRSRGNSQFRVKILRNDWPNFSRVPDMLYRIGSKIRVNGLLEWYQGAPILYVHNPSQIMLISPPASDSP